MYIYIYICICFYICIYTYTYIYIYVGVKRVSPQFLGPHVLPSCRNLLQVGKLVRDHLQTASTEQEPISDQGLCFFDSGSESDDSGIQDLIGTQ